MKRYNTYKNSGVEWIGDIPENWDSIKLKFLGYLFSGLSGKKGDDFKRDDSEFNKNYIPFTNIANNSVIDPNRLDSVEIFENENQNDVKKNDLFFLMSSENYEDIGKTALLKVELENTYLNSFCKGFRLNNQDEVDASFLNYLLAGDIYRKILSIEAKGFTRINLQMGKIQNLPVIMPQNKDEQIQIANYLDYKTCLINNIIAQKEELIQKLKEQRQAIINEAVTEGLNSNVPLKDSGIAWLGEIPKHWEVVKLSYYIDVVGGSTPSSSVPEYWDGEVNWVTTDDLGKLKTKDITTTRRKITELGLNNCSASLIPKNSVIISSRAPIGHLGILSIEAATNQGCKGLVPIKDDILSEYLYYVLLTSKKELESLGTGSTFMEISASKLKDFKIIIPPKEEQREILNHIESESTIIDKSAALNLESIEKLKEYRQSLISEAVTGKIDVRDWQVPNND